MGVPTVPSPYLLSIALVVLAMLALGVLVLRACQNARAVRTLFTAVGAVVAGERGRLRARAAALKVALDERRRKPAPGAVHRVRGHGTMEQDH